MTGFELRKRNEQQVFATHSSNFIPSIELESCINCGICADRCQIHAITMIDQGNGREVPVLDNERCIGYGACVSACPSGSLTMSSRSVLNVPPADGREKLRRMASEKGR